MFSIVASCRLSCIQASSNDVPSVAFVQANLYPLPSAAVAPATPEGPQVMLPLLLETSSPCGPVMGRAAQRGLVAAKDAKKTAGERTGTCISETLEMSY